MLETTSTHTFTTDSCTAFAGYDVFAAARWLAGLGNSSAKAASLTEIEWQCATWGSGSGGGDWLDTGIFTIISTVCQLDTCVNENGRDELIVRVPLPTFPHAAALIGHLGEDPEAWPWLAEDDEEDQLKVGAEHLGVPLDVLAADAHLLTAMGIR